MNDNTAIFEQARAAYAAQQKRRQQEQEEWQRAGAEARRQARTEHAQKIQATLAELGIIVAITADDLVPPDIDHPQIVAYELYPNLRVGFSRMHRAEGRFVARIFGHERTLSTLEDLGGALLAADQRTAKQEEERQEEEARQQAREVAAQKTPEPLPLRPEPPDDSDLLVLSSDMNQPLRGGVRLAADRASIAITPFGIAPTGEGRGFNLSLDAAQVKRLLDALHNDKTNALSGSIFVSCTETTVLWYGYGDAVMTDFGENIGLLCEFLVEWLAYWERYIAWHEQVYDRAPYGDF